MSKIKIILMTIMGLLIVPVSALAFDVRGGETMEIKSGEVLNDDLLIAGGSVKIDGQVNGDIKATGAIIEINGRVDGDVAVAGSQVTIRGEITDDLYVAGGQVNVENKIGDNVVITGGVVRISDNSEIGRDLRIYGGMVDIDAEVKGDVDAGVGQLTINGNVNGNLNGEFDKLKIGSDVIITGDMSYSSPSEVEIDSSSSINGIVDWTKTEPKPYTEKNNGYNFFARSLAVSILWKVFKTISLILLGIVLLLLFPKEIKKIVDRLAGEPGNSILWGLLVCIVVPFVIIGLLITLLGIPLAIILMCAYTIVLLLSTVVVSLWVGRSLLLALSKKKNVSMIWSVVVGGLIMGILFSIPLIGIIVKIIAVLFGVGVIFMSLRHYFAKRR